MAQSQQRFVVYVQVYGWYKQVSGYIKRQTNSIVIDMKRIVTTILILIVFFI